MRKSEIVTTLAVVGTGAEKVFAKAHADPRRFVFAAQNREKRFTTPFGEVGIDYQIKEVN